jgi:ornithine carbamoyltransferase
MNIHTAPASFPTDTLPKASVRRFAWDLDLSQEELVQLLDLTATLKRSPAAYARALEGRYLSLLFEKPSLRTRLTFELAIKQLGGDAVFSSGPIAEREPLKDVARNLERWTHAIVARVFSQQTIEELARWASVPVINALSDLYHPCQALADVFTLKERFGELRGLKLAFVGDGNNVAHSLMLTAPRLGINLAVATPPGYAPNAEIAATATGLAAACGTELTITTDPAAALAGADAVYTDVWTSMGFEREADQRRRVFQPYQVNAQLMEMAPNAVFLHCLPAKRGEEVTDEVIESPRSLVFEQAENRLHTQKALLLMMLA